MKRILLVNFDKRWGGGQEYLIDLVEVCLEEGFGVGQLVAPKSTSAERFREKFLTAKNFSLYPVARSSFAGICQLFKIAKDYDLVHVHREHDLWIGPLMKLLNPKLKLVFSQPVLPTKKRFLMSFYDRVICNSLFVQAHFQKKYPQKTTAVIYPCVDSNLLEANHKEASELAGEPKVLMSGAYWKNQKELVSIFKLFLKEAPKACLYFIGPSEEGQQVDELRSAIQSQNLGAQAVILAPRGRENYLSLLRQIDIFAYTHLNEAFGIAVLEAALLEKPIVAYGAGGIVEILQDYPKASLIEPGDQSSFAEALSHIYKGKPMADANLNNLKQKFSKEKFKAAHKKIYDEFL